MDFGTVDFPRGGGGSEGYSHIRMIVVFFRGRNPRFSIFRGCSGETSI